MTATTKKIRNKLHCFAEELAEATDNALQNPLLVAYLKFCARFHSYSMHNTCLIFAQCEHATKVAGYNKWLEMGRQVRKGEKGISILAPIFSRKKDDDDSKALRGFMAVRVFDINQTSGEPLPDDPMLTRETCPADLIARLLDFAVERDIVVTTGSINGAYGSSCGGKITLDPDLQGSDRFAVLVHELGHELLHKVNNKPDRKTCEVQAEMVAHIVCSHFSIPSAAPNYLFGQGATGQEILTQLQPVVSTIQNIISALESVQAPTATTNCDTTGQSAQVISA